MFGQHTGDRKGQSQPMIFERNRCRLHFTERRQHILNALFSTNGANLISVNVLMRYILRPTLLSPDRQRMDRDRR